MTRITCFRRFNRSSRPLFSLFCAVLALVLAAGGAAAHVSIRPAAAPPNTNETFSVRVPTEKASPTVRVRIEFPAGVTVSRFQPKPGWQRADERDGTGRIAATTWSGGRIENGEFDEFVFIARTPQDAGTLRFRAFQTYGDGETVEWVNNADPGAAPVLEVRAASQSTSASGEHGQTAATSVAPATTGAPAATSAASTPAPTARAATPGSPAGVGAQSAQGAQSVQAAGTSSGMPPSSGSDLPLFIALGSGVVALIAAAMASIALARKPAAV